jgi:hypothetical protein
MKTKTTNPNLIKFSDVKLALQDGRFRETLPDSLLPELQEFLKNPGCPCNAPLYRKVLQHHSEQLRQYFPTKTYVSPEVEDEKLSKNYWSVINCHADELETKMKALHKSGRKQIAIARFEDQITVLINELDVLY